METLKILENVRAMLDNPNYHCVGEYARSRTGRRAPYWQISDVRNTNGSISPRASKWSIMGAVLLYTQINNLDIKHVTEVLGPDCERHNDRGHEHAMKFLDGVIEQCRATCTASSASAG